METTEVAPGRVDMLAGLAPDETSQLVAVCRTLRLRPGERVFVEGDAGDELFIVRHGRVRITKTISPEVSRTLAVVERGGVFGELVIVDAGARSATAESVDSSEVIALGRDAFQKLMADRPQLGLKLLGRLAASLAERLRLTNDLLRETLAWGLEVSGAAALTVAKVIQTKADVRVQLLNGREHAGRLLKVDRSSGGLEVTIRGQDERIFILPYHAIASIELSGESASRGIGEV